MHRIGMAADIEKAFLMVSVAEEDRDVLRLLWSKDIHQKAPEVTAYRFTRVVFGVKCSPFLLNATLQHHIRKFEAEDPSFVHTLLSSLYVDDVSFGASSEEEAFQLFSKAKTRLAAAQFNLRKFITNSHLLQEQVDSHEEESPSPSTIQDDQTFAKASLGIKGEKSKGEKESKILGVTWRRSEDTLVVSTDKLEESLEEKSPTKRLVVAIAASIFDPLGVMAPSTVLWKMLFQAICKTGATWDQPLTGEQLKEWNRLKTAMKEKKVELVIPRSYGIGRKQKARIAGFSDASKKAYAAVVYLRIEGEEGEEAQIQFLACKTRVAPTKPQSIPRLELMACLLLARLYQSVEAALREVIHLQDPICYTDSQVALHWIQGVDNEWRQFVENRAVSIRQMIPASQWRHCPGALNPADIPSRGMLPQELKQETRWLEGPDWLRRQLQPNSEMSEEVPEECLLEQKKKSHVMVTIQQKRESHNLLIDPTRFSSFKRLIRVTARVLQFCHLCRGRRRDLMELLEEARVLLLRDMQEDLLAEKSFTLWRRQLNLTVDDRGLWRCAGRMENSCLEPAARQPILLHRRHHLTRLLVQEAHERVLHNGVRETLTEVRARYWIPRGRQLIKQVIHKCPVCLRFEGRPYRGRPTPPLPEFQVQQSRPFAAVGIDFAGPLYCKGQETPKTWICLFTCCSTRAIHLELVPDLTAESFIRSLKRFSSRRGIPEKVITDNAQTFKSAHQMLKTLLEDPQVRAHLEGRSIEWKFITEKAPWQGGVYERLVKSTKRCLRKAIGRNSLTYEELSTLLAEVEATLNSRPLTYPDEDDLEEALTPSHLVTGYRILSLPDSTTEEDEDYNPTPEGLTRRMKHLAQIQDNFWRRWKREYLAELRDHHRWAENTPGVEQTITEGEPVVVYDEAQPRGMWRLGKVEALIRSTDGCIRAAEIKVHSKSGRPTTIRRPIQHLHPLEVRENPSTEVPEKATEGAAPEKSNNQPSQERTDQDPNPDQPQELLSRSQRPRRAASAKARVRFQDLASQNLI